MMPLTLLKPGEEGMVVRIQGEEARKHLEDLGFTSGTPVRVISSPGRGNLIVSCKDARLAITAQMAAKILVTV
jgi:ferrous iron transport protein A